MLVLAEATALLIGRPVDSGAGTIVLSEVGERLPVSSGAVASSVVDTACFEVEEPSLSLHLDSLKES